MIAQTRQKILVVKLAEANSAGLQNGDPIEVTYPLPNPLPPSTLDARVKRVSEYPNDIDEFQIPTPTPTLTLLIEWDSGPDFINVISSFKKGTQTIPIMDQTDQANNFIINPRPPNSEPDPPFQNLFLEPGLLSMPVAKIDFSPDAYAIIDGKLNDFPDETIKVVVSDTGLKFNLNHPPKQSYTTCNGISTHFPIAPNPNQNATPADLNRIGFCSLTNYLDDTYPLPPRDVSFPAEFRLMIVKYCKTPTTTMRADMVPPSQLSWLRILLVLRQLSR